MDVLKFLNKRIAESAATANKEDAYEAPYILQPDAYVLGNNESYCNGTLGAAGDPYDCASEKHFIGYRSKCHGVWMYTLLKMLMSIDVATYDLDVTYTYAVATNASFRPMMESVVSTGSALDDPQANDVFMGIAREYRDDISMYLMGATHCYLKKIHELTIAHKSNLVPLAIQARSAEYIRGRIRHLRDHLTHADLRRTTSILLKETDTMWTAVKGYRMANTDHHGDTYSSVGSTTLTSDDMVDLLNIAGQLLDTPPLIWWEWDRRAVNEYIKSIAMIYMVIHELCGRFVMGDPSEDYMSLYKSASSKTSNAYYRRVMENCRAMSGMSPTAALCMIGTIDKHHYKSIDGKTIAPIDPDSLSERFLFLVGTL